MQILHRYVKCQHLWEEQQRLPVQDARPVLQRRTEKPRVDKNLVVNVSLVTSGLKTMYLETWRIVMIILVSAWFFGIMGWVIGYIQGWHWGQGLTLSGEKKHFKLVKITPEG